jgi:hypothetical protein
MLNEQYIGQFQKMEVRAPLLQSYPDFTSTRMIKKIESFIFFLTSYLKTQSLLIMYYFLHEQFRNEESRKLRTLPGGIILDNLSCCPNITNCGV